METLWLERKFKNKIEKESNKYEISLNEKREKARKK